MLTLKSVGYFQAPKNAHGLGLTIPPGEEWFELVTGGRVYFEVEGEDRACECGSLFWHVAGEGTIRHSDPDFPYACLIVRFKASSGSKRNLSRYTFWDNKIAVKDFAQESLRAFHATTAHHKPLGGYIEHRLKWVAHSFAQNSPPTPYPDPLPACLDCIEREYASLDSIQALAREVEVSPSHLHALFKQYLQVSPHQYLLKRRLQAARYQLVTTRSPIKQISYDCGFRSVENFCRTFRRNFGTNPKSYRLQYSQ